jgi:hypothetical protein
VTFSHKDHRIDDVGSRPVIELKPYYSVYRMDKSRFTDPGTKANVPRVSFLASAKTYKISLTYVVSRVWEPTNRPQNGKNHTGPSLAAQASLRTAQALLKPAQALLRGCTASAQGKAATVQGGSPNWSWGKKIFCPTIGVFHW